jgi:hypothetical protein
MATLDGSVQIKNWSKFGQSKGLVDVQGIPQVACDAGGSVASAAASSAGLQVEGYSNVGGDLGSLDIKRMDVKTAISMSLMHHYVTTGDLYEIVANSEGGASFVKVGSSGGNMGTLYYNVQTTSFPTRLSDVMVTGGKPLPEVKFGKWYDVLQIGTKGEVFDQSKMVGNCRLSGFTNYATIVYPDPHLGTEYNDGIDNMYDVTTPWEKVIGYVHYKEPPEYVKDKPEIKITWNNEASIPIQVGEPGNPKMGNIQTIETRDMTTGDANCFAGPGTGQEIKYTDGVKIEIPSKWRYTNLRGIKIDKFIKVSAVYLIGMRIDSLFYAPNSTEKMFDETTSSNNSVLWASINKEGFNTFKCEEGRHYAIAYDSSGDLTPYIVFAKDIREGDPFKYGENTSFKIDPFCTWALKNPDGKTQGTIFPITKSEGLWVTDIWALVDIETPSITVFDPVYGKAMEIAKTLKYNLCPISIIDKPAPIGLGSTGDIIGQESMQKDADPTTVQNFTDTDLEKAMDKMQGSGMSVSWSFLKETDVGPAARKLYDLLSSDTTVENVFTFGPDSNPTLCAGYAGGVINAIRYSYTDQGSYTVSVTTGPMLTPSSMVQVDGGPTPMMTEDFGARGVVIASNGDNVNFKVRIDGLGDRWAVCMTPHIIRTGDAVQCSIHNNPVEY